MTNRLADSTSPYLQQHADNPVDWWPWCDEAFEEAKRRDVPVFLSIGYAACHWCHVMANESFEDPATAQLLNADFVSIKVDREERPDIDAVYMSAVQGLTGHGGWPMTVFLNADRQPFHAGTYFPLEPRAGMPSFRQLLVAVSDAWTNRRGEIDDGAAKITQVLRSQQASGPAHLDAGALEAGALEIGALEIGELDAATGIAVQRLAHEFDPVNAGFGSAPKFPPSTVLRFLFRHYRRTGAREALAMASETCEAMARGGLYDQLAGGFARYSVDAGWVVPHFEKMLYDNALLLSVYTDWFAVSGSALARRVCEETAAFMLSDLRTIEGGFASSLDADALSPGDGKVHEGISYVWDRSQLVDVLGEEDGLLAAQLLEVTSSGTFEGGKSVLQLLSDPAANDWWQRVRSALLAARNLRPQPARDDKIVAAWNGLAIAALAKAGRIFERPDWIEAAVCAADLIVKIHIERRDMQRRDMQRRDMQRRDDEAQLVRVSRDGTAAPDARGVLEDYGDVAEGFLALYEVTGDERWLTASGQLLRTVLDDFQKPDGGFFDTASDGEELIVRPSDPTDLASPSGWSAVTSALLTYGTLTASDEHLRAAETGLVIAVKLGTQAPRFAGWLLAAGEALLDGPIEVIVVGDDSASTRELSRAAVDADRPGAVVVQASEGATSTGPFADRPTIDGQAAAYVCRGSFCYPPVQSPDEVSALLELAQDAAMPTPKTASQIPM